MHENLFLVSQNTNKKQLTLLPNGLNWLSFNGKNKTNQNGENKMNKKKRMK